MGDIIECNIRETKQIVEDCIATKTPLLIEGAPGIGKTSIVGQCASASNLTLETLILSIRDQVDVGGFPLVHDGQIAMLPIGPLKRACEAPSVLFLDELTQTDSRMQGAAMRLVLERYAGDSKLHQDTAVIGAYNPVSQAVGGTELMPPMTNRFCLIKLVPEIEEIKAHFKTAFAADPHMHDAATEFAATLEVMPTLLQLDPPSGSTVSMAQWASPRSWERALKNLAHQTAQGATDVESMTVDIPQPDGSFVKEQRTVASTRMRAMLVGSLGPDIGNTYLSLAALRKQLPSCADIVSDPHAAKLPKDITGAAALMGVVVQVIKADPWAAWIYVMRLQDEAKRAALRVVYQAPIRPDHKSKWDAQGRKTRMTGMVEVAKMLAL